MKKKENPEAGTLHGLEPAGWNPRRIGKRAEAGLQASLERFGDLACLVYNRGTKKKEAGSGLVCGHQRRAALERMLEASGGIDRVEWGEGYQTRRGAERDGTLTLPDGSRFRVREVDWDETMEAAANTAANNPAIQGEWTEGLSALLEMIEGGGSRGAGIYQELLLAELEGAGAVTLKGLKIVDCHGRPPRLAWALIGVPIAEFGRVQGALDGLREVRGIHIEVCGSDNEPHHSNGQ